MLYYKVGVDFDRVGDVICHNTKKGNIEILKYCRAQEEEPMDKDFELLFDKKEGNVLTDLLANDNGWFLVSERFRETILEQFNTNVQFFDVKIKEVQSRSILEQYYIANNKNKCEKSDHKKKKSALLHQNKALPSVVLSEKNCFLPLFRLFFPVSF